MFCRRRARYPDLMRFARLITFLVLISITFLSDLSQLISLRFSLPVDNNIRYILHAMIFCSLQCYKELCCQILIYQFRSYDTTIGSIAIYFTQYPKLTRK